jgi:probable rRNA maturation factor
MQLDRFWPANLVRQVSDIVQFVLAAEKVKATQQVTVALSSDARVRVLNRDWRGKDKPTNVLSFPMHEVTPEGYWLGDIVLARQTLEREAKTERKLLKHHFTHLLVHGTLHLLGYDHMKENEAKVMERREIKLLAQLGVPNPYAPNSVDKAPRRARMRT